MGGSFRRGLNSEVVTFSTRLAFRPLPLYKSNKEKMQDGSLILLYPVSPWPERLYSIQVQLLGMLIKRYY